MKSIKLFSLVVVATIATAALAAAGTASAAGVHSCYGPKETESPCGEGLALFTGERTYHILTSTFASSFATVTCAKGEEVGKMTSSGSKTENANGKIEKVSLSECSSLCGTATMAAFKLPWSYEAVNTEAEVMKAAGIEYTTCGETCKYEAAEMKVKIAGGKEATAELAEVPFKRVGGGLLCSSSATWKAVSDLLPQHFAYTVLI
jgi:hypothetical protein